MYKIIGNMTINGVSYLVIKTYINGHLAYWERI